MTRSSRRSSAVGQPHAPPEQWRTSRSRARRDLREIHRGIAQDDPVAADRILSDLRDAVTRLAEMPGLGHVRDDLADQTLRAWPVRRYVVIYQPDRAPLLIVRVLSGYRDIGSIFT